MINKTRQYNAKLYNNPVITMQYDVIERTFFNIVALSNGLIV